MSHNIPDSRDHTQKHRQETLKFTQQQVDLYPAEVTAMTMQCFKMHVMLCKKDKSKACLTLSMMLLCSLMLVKVCACSRRGFRLFRSKCMNLVQCLQYFIHRLTVSMSRKQGDSRPLIDDMTDKLEACYQMM